MGNSNYTYCKGKECFIRSKCNRYTMRQDRFAYVEPMYNVLDATCALFEERDYILHGNYKPITE